MPTTNKKFVGMKSGCCQRHLKEMDVRWIFFLKLNKKKTAMKRKQMVLEVMRLKCVSKQPFQNGICVYI